MEGVPWTKTKQQNKPQPSNWFPNMVTGDLPSAFLSLALVAACWAEVADSVVDPEALNFERGVFDTCINGQTFQIEAVTSFQG